MMKWTSVLPIDIYYYVYIYSLAVLKYIESLAADYGRVEADENCKYRK